MAEKPSESTLKNADGLNIFCRYWYPDNKDVRALVHVIHGVGEHIGRYDAVAASFTKLGCLVYGHDHVGHGRSEGVKVDVKDFQLYVKDCLQHTTIMTEKYPNLPVIAFGHSMGGTIAILMMNSHSSRFAGAIFGSPCVAPSQATPFLIFMARGAAYMFPQLAVAKLVVSDICRDPAVVEDYVKDPLVWHGGVKARWAVKMYDACMQIQAECEHKANYPFLLQHGSKDAICDIKGSDLFFERSKSQSKVYKKYEGYFHELDKEPEGEREVVFKDMEDWTRDLLDSLEGSKVNGPKVDGPIGTETASPSDVDVKS
ncbi:monoglyceride lipase isoform X2 [Strongylocentrotus purpuratus]|uniref:Serine aminopeptidase S33 domain-containing protein n=1 Tax=Strongylocentrotus purpuratus TaxID=7668 RepID=A0A7M7MYY9_STRPU|nr:monoglyceride lipase isoform X2 [Strongylocentrotus purpuratus]